MTGDEIVEAVAPASWDDPQDMHDPPQSAKSDNDSDRRLAAHVQATLGDQQIAFPVFWIEAVMTIKCLSQCRLRGRKTEAAGGIMAQDETDEGAAKSADAVEDDKRPFIGKGWDGWIGAVTIGRFCQHESFVARH